MYTNVNWIGGGKLFQYEKPFQTKLHYNLSFRSSLEKTRSLDSLLDITEQLGSFTFFKPTLKPHQISPALHHFTTMKQFSTEIYLKAAP